MKIWAPRQWLLGAPGFRGTYPAWLPEVQEVEGLGWCIRGHGWWGQGVGKARQSNGGKAFQGEGPVAAKARQGTQRSVTGVKGGAWGSVGPGPAQTRGYQYSHSRCGDDPLSADRGLCAAMSWPTWNHQNRRNREKREAWPHVNRGWQCCSPQRLAQHLGTYETQSRLLLCQMGGSTYIKGH